MKKTFLISFILSLAIIPFGIGSASELLEPPDNGLGSLLNPDVSDSHYQNDGSGEKGVIGLWASDVQFGDPVGQFQNGQEVWGVVVFEHPGGFVMDDLAAVLEGTTKVVSPVCSFGADNLEAGSWRGSCMIGTVPRLRNCVRLQAAGRHADSTGVQTIIGQSFMACP
jgi:hypothetical protein